MKLLRPVYEGLPDVNMSILGYFKETFEVSLSTGICENCRKLSCVKFSVMFEK